MATALETALANIEAKIAEASANPKPSYTIDGKTVYWNDYLQMLLKARQGIVDAIAQSSPYVIRSQVG